MHKSHVLAVQIGLCGQCGGICAVNDVLAHAVQLGGSFVASSREKQQYAELMML